MLLTLTTTHNPATDLGYLLHKHPDRVQEFSLKFGKVTVFYPTATAELCTCAVLVEIDPIRLTRRGRGKRAFALQPYVNDRLYVASSFLSVAINNVFRNALKGESKDRQAVADTPIPLTAKISVVASRGGERLLHDLFAPLGYDIQTERYTLDNKFPAWGESRYYTLTLSHTIRLADLLTHLYVLLPVLDDGKHYWVGDDEIEKLLRRGGDWLATHPEKEQITRRYLRHQRQLTHEALAQMAEESDPDPDGTATAHDAEEAQSEQKIGLHQQRLEAVVTKLKGGGATSVLDLGCGEGRLLRLLLAEGQFRKIAGIDVAYTRLEKAKSRLKVDWMPDAQRERLTLLQSSLTYRDERLLGYGAAAVVEVIEHLDPHRLATFERVLFGYTRPKMVVLTTPNREYNVMWESLPTGSFRHRDHRFEWTRAEFEAWGNGVAEAYGYGVEYAGIGEADDTVGSPSQMAVFTLS